MSSGEALFYTTKKPNRPYGEEGKLTRLGIEKKNTLIVDFCSLHKGEGGSRPYCLFLNIFITFLHTIMLWSRLVYQNRPHSIRFLIVRVN